MATLVQEHTRQDAKALCTHTDALSEGSGRVGQTHTDGVRETCRSGH